MAEKNLNKHDAYDAKPFPIGKASILTVFLLIVLFVIGSLLISGFFVTDRKGLNQSGNSSQQANS